MTWSRRDIFVLMLGLLLSQQAWNMLSTGKKRRRAYNSVRALYSLATMPNEDWEEYYKSLDQVMVKEKLETAEDEQLVAAWYKIVNFFCDLGNLEKMYIPPLVDPALGLEENQILIENKMALAAASGDWNATLINGLDETLPPQYKRRYVVHKKTGKRSILPVNYNNTRTPPEYAPREMDVLELGCGKGRILHDMVMYTGGTGNGINIDKSQLENAVHLAQRKKLFPHRLNFTHGSLNDAYPFPDESLDFAYEVGAFTYVIDKLAVFKEIFRVLRPGGAFCYNDWTVLESFDPTDEVQVAKLLKIKKFSGLIELHNPKELAAVAEEAGFEVVWNGHGGYGAVPTSGLLGNMHHSFRYADSFMQFIVNYGLLPKGLAKGWKLLRDGKGVHVLKESMDKKWLDVGHIFLIRKPHDAKAPQDVLV